MANEELVDSGQLNKRVDYQAKVYAGPADIHGKKPYTWQTQCSRYASIESVAGRESQVTDRLKIVATHVVTTRYIPGANAEGRLIYEGRVFNISYVNDVNMMHVKMKFYVNETVNPQ